MRKMYLVMVRHTVEENDKGDGEKFEAIIKGGTKGKRKVVSTSCVLWRVAWHQPPQSQAPFSVKPFRSFVVRTI